MNWSPRLPRLHHLAGSLHLRQARHGGVHRGFEAAQIGAGAFEQCARPVGLRQHRRQHMGRLDVRVVARHREALGLGERLLESGGQFVDAHVGAGTTRLIG
jgi:hypothetical protein